MGVHENPGTEVRFIGERRGEVPGGFIQVHLLEGSRPVQYERVVA